MTQQRNPADLRRRLLRLPIVTRLLVLGAAATAACAPAAEPPGNVGWNVYRGDPGAGQFADLAQINAANVHRLAPAWHYRTGDATQRSTMHANPIVVDGVMYVTTPSMKT